MLRTILTITQKNLTIDLPENFVGKQVEILTFVIDKASTDSKPSRKTFFPLQLDTLNYKFNREEANER